jgi:thiol:disulfide interchange protein
MKLEVDNEAKLSQVVKEAVRDALEEEILKLRLLFAPYLSDEEQEEIEKTYYLYQNSIKITHKNRSVEFELIGDPVVHKDEFLGETVIYRNSLDLEILDQSEQNLMNYEVVFQGCAEKRFCYTPIKVKLSSL